MWRKKNYIRDFSRRRNCSPKYNVLRARDPYPVQTPWPTANREVSWTRLKHVYTFTMNNLFTIRNQFLFYHLFVLLVFYFIALLHFFREGWISTLHLIKRGGEKVFIYGENLVDAESHQKIMYLGRATPTQCKLLDPQQIASDIELDWNTHINSLIKF